MKKVSITIQLDKETLDKIKAKADSLSISTSSMIRILIANALPKEDLACMDIFTKE